MSSTTADKINYLLDTKEEIRQAINEKFVDVPTSATFRSYADSIRAIPTGNKMCRFVIGTKTAGWTEKDCDYLCDGVDDQVEINAAIQALPSTGGEIKVLDGTYNITAPISIDKERVTFGGCGQSTIFKRMWKGSSASDSVITFSKSYCTFKYFQIDGNNRVYNGGSGLYLTEKNMTNILVEGVVCKKTYIGISLSSAQNSTATGNTCNNNNNTGIFLSSAQNSTATGNTCNNNRIYGISLNSVQNSIATGNTCLRGEGTSSDYTSSQHTIYMDSNTTDCVVVGNNCSGKAPTSSGTGNIVANNKS